MPRRRHTPDQIIRKLRAAGRMLGEGADLAAVARHLAVSRPTYYRGRNQFGGLTPTEHAARCPHTTQQALSQQLDRQPGPRHSMWTTRTTRSDSSIS